MKINFKVLIIFCISLLTGIFIGAEISMQSLFLEIAKFMKSNVNVNVAGVIATSSASIVALIVAAWGWKEAKKQRNKDREEREQKEAKDILIIENNNAAYTSRYLRYLFTIAQQLGHKGNAGHDFIRLKGSKLLLDKLSEGWKKVVATQNMSNTVSYIDNLQGMELIPTLENTLIILEAAVNADDTAVQEKVFDDYSVYVGDILFLMFKHANCFQRMHGVKLGQSYSVIDIQNLDADIINLTRQINEKSESFNKKNEVDK